MVVRSQRLARGNRPDYTLAVLLLLLTIIGVLMVYSASVVSSFDLAQNPTFYSQRQMMYVLLGFVVFIIVSRIHYTFWKKIAPLFLIISVLLSAMVLIPGIGTKHGGATSWLELGPISFQPTEVLKIGVILYFALLFERVGRGMATLKSFLPFVSILIVIGGIVMLQPDLGTLTIIVAFSTIMFYIAGANIFHIGALLAGGALGLWALIQAAPYRMQRFMVFLDPSADSSGAGYQINQALIAIGTGGLFGLGFNQSRQKFQYLPEAQTDSIIAIMAEELGFIKITIIVAIFAYLIIRTMNIARRAPDVFSRMIVIGVISWVAVQAIVNMGAMLSLMPLTGVPLPFISYGGSSILVLMFAFGIVVNISKYIKGGKDASDSGMRGNWRSYIPGLSGNRSA